LPDRTSSTTFAPPLNARPIFTPEIEQLGGGERSLLALCRWLTAQNLPNYLLTYFDHCNLAQYADFPLSVVSLNPASGARAKIASLGRHLKARPASAPRVLCSGYQPALHATLAGVRGFHDIMHDTPSLFGDEDCRSRKDRLRIAISNRIAGFGLRSGGVTLVNSEYLKAECRRDFGIDAQIVRMGGLEAGLERTAARPALPGAPMSLLSVCRIEQNKRIDWLLRALAKLEHSDVPPLSARLSQLVDWSLDLAGKGAMIAELTRMAEALGIADRVHFHGFVTDAKLEELYANAQLFLMPAVQGYGIPALEALERHIPVLLHRDSGVSDLLLDTPWASVVTGGEEGFAESLAAYIDSILHKDALRVPIPRLPTESGWAQRVAELCGWL
jgi:glycosyltransferase involved in cell wall biosynthesis